MTATLSWKTYGWGMQSVWLENVLQHQPKRWLPEAYGSYDDLLAAAVEAAVSGPEAPQDLASWNWGAFRPVEIQHPILGRIPLLQRWTGPGVQPQSGSGYTVKAVSRSHGPSERLTVDLSDLDQSTLEPGDRRGGKFSQSVLHGSVEGMVRRLHVQAAIFAKSSCGGAAACAGAGAEVSSQLSAQSYCAIGQRSKQHCRIGQFRIKAGLRTTTLGLGKEI